jgi:metallo-beta-lactamase family protein
LAYIQFLGAAGTVTGSKHLVNTSSDGAGGGFQMLIDCGLFQGAKDWRERNWQPTPVPAREIDAVILTHAHPGKRRLPRPNLRHAIHHRFMWHHPA